MGASINQGCPLVQILIERHRGCPSHLSFPSSMPNPAESLLAAFKPCLRFRKVRAKVAFPSQVKGRSHRDPGRVESQSPASAISRHWSGASLLIRTNKIFLPLNLDQKFCLGNVQWFWEYRVSFSCLLNQMHVIFMQFVVNKGNILFVLAPVSLEENNH